MIDIPDSIFPTDIEGNLLCPKCKRVVKDCDCPTFEPVKAKVSQPKVKPVVRLDKSGRKGKVVTVITNLPTNELYLKDLAKNLKTKTGSGGTFYTADGVGIVEIQGDHKQTLEDLLKKLIG